MVAQPFLLLRTRFSRTGRMTLLTLITSMSMQTLTVITGALTARTLGVEGRGFFAACTLIPLLLISLGNLGGPIATTYLSARDHSLARTLARQSVIVTLVSSIVLVPLSVMITSLMTKGYSDVLPKTLLFSLVALPVMMLGINLNAINQGTGRLVQFNVIRLLSPLVYCVLMIGLLISHQGSITMALIAWLIAAVVFLAATMPRLLEAVPSSRWLDRSILQTTYRYGLRAHLGSVAPIDSFRLDLALVIAILSPRDAGLYAVAVAIASMVRTQASAMGMISLPAVAGERLVAAQVKAARRYFLATLVIVVVLASALSLATGQIISLVYGDEFQDAHLVTILLIWAMVVASARQAVGDILRAFGVPGNASISEVISWIACVPAVFLVRDQGLTGAALAVMLAYMISLVAVLLLPSSKSIIRAILHPEVDYDSAGAGQPEGLS